MANVRRLCEIELELKKSRYKQVENNRNFLLLCREFAPHCRRVKGGVYEKSLSEALLLGEKKKGNFHRVYLLLLYNTHRRELQQWFKVIRWSDLKLNHGSTHIFYQAPSKS
jgi:hypothetical protein